MYVVIFRARIACLDEDYFFWVSRLRTLAMETFGCNNIVSLSENGEELTLSYWDSLAQIAAWAQNAEHLQAKAKADRWYSSYSVQITKRV